MKKTKLVAFILAAFAASPAHAIFGVGDLSFDPTNYAELVKQLDQMKKLYETAKTQVEGLMKIERTIKDAQQAYKIIASGDLKTAMGQLKVDPGNLKTAAGLRAELANLESKGTQNVEYVKYQLSLVGQLENLQALQKASSTNAQQSTGQMNVGTAAAVTAQSTATLAALAAAEEQRRVQEQYEKQKAAKQVVDGLDDASGLYKAIGKN
jgi:hypothetical protein